MILRDTVSSFGIQKKYGLIFYSCRFNLLTRSAAECVIGQVIEVLGIKENKRSHEIHGRVMWEGFGS